jgi:hypothetical protein
MMNPRCLSLALVVLVQGAWAQTFQERGTSASQVRMSVTNVGTFGNAFRGYRDGTGTPSCEYPAGSGTEHLLNREFGLVVLMRAAEFG